MKPKTNLYFIAIIPPEEVCFHIENIKLSLARSYNCKHALRMFPYLSLQSPFQQLPYREDVIKEKLKVFAHRQHPISIRLKGFGAVPDKSIHVKVKNNTELKGLHEHLSEFLIEELLFSQEMVGYGYHPHITIAAKDIKNNFRRIFNEYKGKKFEASFMVQEMHLFKHDYAQWQLVDSFEFKGVGYTMDLFKQNSIHEKQLVMYG